MVSRRRTMKLNRLILVVLCLGVLAGSALAGTTTTTVVNYAREVGAANQIYVLPATTITRNTVVTRDNTQNFFVDVILNNGARFNAALAGTELAVTEPGMVAGDFTITLVGGTGGANSTTATYLVQVDTTVSGDVPTGYLTATFTPVVGQTIKDVNNVLGGGGIITVDVVTRNAADTVPFDNTSTQCNWLRGVYGVSSTAPTSVDTIIDVASGRTKFVGNVTADNPASVTTAYFVGGLGSTPVAYDTAGVQYVLTAADNLTYRATGDLSGVAQFTVCSVTPVCVTRNVTAGDRTNGYAEVVFPGNTAVAANPYTLSLVVDGSTPQTSRAFTVQTTENQVVAAGRPAFSNVILPATQFANWKYNGTILLAPWVNGNNAFYSSRVYIFNPNSFSGNVTVTVYPITAKGVPAQIALGSVDLGSIAGKSGGNFKLKEDILDVLAVTQPYSTNNGNLMLEFTILLPKAYGSFQTYNSTMTFGMMELLLEQ